VRVPGLVRWTGKVQPGVTHSVATTYDIFSTVMALAGVPLPTDRIIDGRDLTPLLLGINTTSPHDCLFIYKGTPGLGCPHDKPDCPGLWAVRCGE
jgi:hypothetical protein